MSLDILRVLLVTNRVTSGGFRVTLDGELVRRLTAEVGFSLVDLARASRVSRPTIRRAIQGAPITPRSAARIADALSRRPSSASRRDHSVRGSDAYRSGEAGSAIDAGLIGSGAWVELSDHR